MSLFDNPDQPSGLKAIDWTSPESAQPAIDANFNATVELVKGIHAEVAKGSKTDGELKAAVDKIAVDLNAIDRGLADLKARAQVEAKTSTGPESGLSRFVVVDKDGAPSLHLRSGPMTHRGQKIGNMPGLLDSTETYGDFHREIKEVRRNIQFIIAAKKNRGESSTSIETVRRHAPQSLARLAYLLEQVAPSEIRGASKSFVQRLFSNVTDNGAAFIPAENLMPDLAADLKYSGIGLASDVIPRFTMSNGVETMPYVDGVGRPFLYSAGTTVPLPDATETSVTSDPRTITARGMVRYLLMDRDATEDSIIAAIPAMRQFLIVALSLGREDCVFNGDTAATHMDTIAAMNPNSIWSSTTGAGGSSDHRRSYLGLRGRAFDIGATAKLDFSGAMTYDLINQLAGKLDPPHGTDGDMVLAVSYQAYLGKLLGLEQVATVEKYGANASVLSGEVGKVGVFSIVRTPALAPIFETTGLFTDGTGLKETFVAFNRARYGLHQRRGANVESGDDIVNNSTALVARMRETLHSPDHGTTLSSTSVRNVAVGINI